MNIDSVIITVAGPDKSGKGYVIAAIAHLLEQIGCDVQVQASDTHNAKKLAKTDEEITSRMQGRKIVILEQQTR
jgi:hypothetical protein